MRFITAFKTVGLLSYVQLAAIIAASLIVWAELNYDYEQLRIQGVDTVDDTANGGNSVDYPSILEGVISVHSLPMYREIADRPLFSPSRKPPPKPQPLVQVAVVKEPMDYALKLNGVSITGKARTALVWHTTERKYYALERGDTVKNWKVQKINPESVVLNQNGTKMELVLREEPGKTQ
ncbi:hypothetical protein [Kaarinaea lacus]